MKTFDEWVIIFNKIYKNKYEYIRRYKKLGSYYFEIKCKKHGIFHKKTGNHYYKKQGCPNCSKPNKLTKEIFIEKATTIHGEKYDYSKIIYKNNREKVQIICKNHGKFEQTPSNHLYHKQGCPKCRKNRTMDTELFIKLAKTKYNDRFKYDKTIYINSRTKVIVTCKSHGDFLVTPNNHLRGYNCYKCSGITKNTEDFIRNSNIIHKNLYNYEKTNYTGTRKCVIITCKIHGDFKQRPNDHLCGNGCQKCCSSGFSKVCIKWLNDIMKKENIYIQHAKNKGEKRIFVNNKFKYKLDGYCKENNTIYEFYGDFWHGNPKFYDKNDINPITKKKYGFLYKKTIQRENELKKMGYNIVSIWESELKKI